MSIKVVVHIMEHMDLPRPWAAVLLAMGDHADDDGGHCFPSVDRIAWKANYKTRQVINIMRDMEKAGLITKVAESGQHRPAEYQINLDQAPRKVPFEQWKIINGRGSRDAKNAPLENPQGCNLATPDVQSHNSGVQSRDPGVQPIAPEPINRQLEPSVKNRHSARAKRRENMKPFPDDFSVTESMYEWALEKKGLTSAAVDLETEQFTNHHLAKGSRFVDWERAWMHWMGNVSKWGKERAAGRTGSGGTKSRAEDPDRRNWTLEQWLEE